MTGPIITAVDRKAGTITVERGLDFLEQPWTPPTAYMHPQLYSALQGILRQEYGPDIIANTAHFPDSVQRSLPPGTFPAPAVLALTTLCAMEWLRHRKAAVAVAEQSGDYSSLIEEFVAWLRALFAAWREKIGAQT